MLGDCTIAISHALGNDRDAPSEKEPTTSSLARTIPFAAHILQASRAMRAEPRRQMAKFGLAGDPFALGPGAREPPPPRPSCPGKELRPSARRTALPARSAACAAPSRP